MSLVGTADQPVLHGHVELECGGKEMTIATGTKLGSYQVLSQIGAGGMGVVYQAHDTKLGRDVAIKVLLQTRSRMIPNGSLVFSAKQKRLLRSIIPTLQRFMAWKKTLAQATS